MAISPKYVSTYQPLAIGHHSLALAALTQGPDQMTPKQLRTIRKATGLTQAEFAPLLGLARRASTTGDMERGVAPITRQTAMLAHLIRCQGVTAAKALMIGAAE